MTRYQGREHLMPIELLPQQRAILPAMLASLIRAEHCYAISWPLADGYRASLYKICAFSSRSAHMPRDATPLGDIYDFRLMPYFARMPLEHWLRLRHGAMQPVCFITKYEMSLSGAASSQARKILSVISRSCWETMTIRDDKFQ